MVTFTLFPKLPPEVQLEIWNFACLEEGKSSSRVQYIAPDCPFIPLALDRVQIHITKSGSHLVPVLVQVCQIARSLALKCHWTLWPTRNRVDYQETGTKVYINRMHDTFYIGEHPYDSFWLLRALVGPAAPHLTEEEDCQVMDLHSEQLYGIRHFAVDWWVWLSCFARGRFEWMTLIAAGTMEQMTIVIKNPVSESDKWARSKGRLTSITPNTIRNMCAIFIKNWIDPNPESSWRYFDSEEGDDCLYLDRIPKLNFKVMTSHIGPDDKDSSEDRIALTHLEQQVQWYEINCEIEKLRSERKQLKRRMDSLGVYFPPPYEGRTLAGNYIEDD